MNKNLIDWNDMYSVGNPTMDAQHRKLIDTINKLFSAFSDGSAQEVIDSVIQEMINYSKIHLTAEEKMLKEINFTDIESHKSFHEDYRKKILELQQRAKTNEKEIHYEIIEYLKKWWTEHILNEDMKYSDF